MWKGVMRDEAGDICNDQITNVLSVLCEGAETLVNE